MGIPAYFRIVTQKYKGILHFSRPKVCNHFFVDFNGLIHQAAHGILADAAARAEHTEDKEHKEHTEHTSYLDDEMKHDIEKRIIEKTWQYLNDCINIASPTEMIHTCVDGVAPKAKMNQQRKRRYLSILQRTGAIVWDTNAISPGTEFMTKLQTSMQNKIRTSTSRIIHYFSGSDDPGEGEHKLFARLGMVASGKTSIVYGLDADLIMLSLMSHNPNLYLMREQQLSGLATGEGGGATTHEGAFVYLDVHALRLSLLQELTNTHNWPVGVAASEDPYGKHAKDIIESYVTVCFLLGNDFLPHIPSLSLKHNGHSRLLQAAKETWDALGVSPVAGGIINTKFFANLLHLLAKEEDKVFFKMNDEYMKKRPCKEPDPSCAYHDTYPIQKKHKDPLAYEINTMCTPAAWRTLYYKALFHCRLYDTSIITFSSHLFVKGIYWTYSYYKRLPKDPEWLYPFNYAPTVLDLANYMQSSLSHWDTLQATWSKTGTVTGFVTSPIQLMCILPIQSIYLLPKSYRAFMTDRTKGCTHMFPVKYPIQTYLKTHLWECTPVLPPLDTAWLQKCVQLYK